jgi:hypothetical protein
MDYKCSIDIQFPSPLHAQNALDVLSVDEEIGDKVSKSFSTNENLLSVCFASKEAKMLRVAISSFYDMLNVVLKVNQEFS